MPSMTPATRSSPGPRSASSSTPPPPPRHAATETRHDQLDKDHRHNAAMRYVGSPCTWHAGPACSATDLTGLAEDINAQVRGWIGYYGAFYRSRLYPIATRIDQHLVRWAMQKYKRLRGRPQQ